MGSVAFFVALCLWAPAGASVAPEPDAIRVLVAAYPDFLTASGKPNAVRWRDGAEWPYDDHVTRRDYEEMLARPCLKDQMSIGYPAGWPFAIPGVNEDPGRVRCEGFFRRMYGETEKEVRGNLVNVAWSKGKTVSFTRMNGASEALSRVAQEIAQLPTETQRYAAKPIGTFCWRVIAGTTRLSMHSFGAAIDLELPDDCHRFWGWKAKQERDPLVYPEQIIKDEKLGQIVCAFEKHGFIWGGKWYHYDTMHFEYRPELLPARKGPQ